MPRHSTTEQLRQDIDRGRTGDKIKVSDPAAAPLGTDEEAAGTPTPGEAVQQARDYEQAIGRQVHGTGEAAGGPSAAVWIYILIILLLAGLVAAALWLTS
jgi:hypothetical protein